MPVMDGLTSTREIRKYEMAHGQLPAKIIALTGVASESVQKEALASGVDLFLTKPTPMKDLKRILNSWST
jgi:CheY-like chemotaxis protein